MTRYVLLLLMSVSLSACFSAAPDRQRYQLPVTEVGTAIHDATRPVILLSAVELSELLYQPGIVLQTDDITLHPARQHVWSSDLQQQLTHGLQRRLQQRLPDHAVLLNPPAGPTTDSLTLVVRIDAFQGHYAGYALTEGQWQLFEANKTLAIHASSTLKTPLAEDGYGALVRALGENLDQLADEIAKAIDLR